MPTSSNMISVSRSSWLVPVLYSNHLTDHWQKKTCCMDTAHCLGHVTSGALCLSCCGNRSKCIGRWGMQNMEHLDSISIKKPKWCMSFCLSVSLSACLSVSILKLKVPVLCPTPSLYTIQNEYIQHICIVLSVPSLLYYITNVCPPLNILFKQMSIPSQFHL